MKKILFLLVMFIMPIVVFADTTEINNDDFNKVSKPEKNITYNGTCYDLTAGEYKLTGNINLGNTYICISSPTDTSSVKAVTIDLNGYTISSTVESQATIKAEIVDLTIKGNGVVNGSDSVVSRGYLTIESGTFSSDVVVKDQYHIGARLHIIDGEFNDYTNVDGGSNVLIENGVFNDMLDLVVDNSVTIKNATVTSSTVNEISADTVMIENSAFNGAVFGLQISAQTSVEINGGTFSGGMAGLAVYADEDPLPQLVIKSGAFTISDPDSGFGSITIIDSSEIDANYLNSLLLEGYEFQPEPVVETQSLSGLNILAVKNNVNIIHSDYVLISGAGQTHVIGSGKALSFEFSTPLNEFLTDGKVYIDNTLLDSKNYTATKGSTIITLLTEYLDTLKVGDHTINVETSYGNVSATFKVVDETQKEEPKQEEKKEESQKEEQAKKDEEILPLGDNSIKYLIGVIASLTGVSIIVKKEKNYYN